MMSENAEDLWRSGHAGASVADPLVIGPVTTRNRLWLAPMCQYSVTDHSGIPGDWHLVTLGSRAAGGFGLVMTEATAICPEGRISSEDTGIWNDSQEKAWSRIVDFVASQGATPAIQLAHAGRKASTYRGFVGEPRGPKSCADGGWETLGPSAVAFEGLATPKQADVADLDKVVADFVAAATRSVRAGFEVVEIHAAHGYLLHQFLSPLSNFRDDEYGGCLENRYRLLGRVIRDVKAVLPQSVALVVRISATDWTTGGLGRADTVTYCRWMRDAGVDLVDVSTGGNVLATIPVSPGYQVPFATTLRQEADIPVAAVGLITKAQQAEQIVQLGQADAVMIGRQALVDPTWAIKTLTEICSGVPAGVVPPAAQRGHWG